LNPFRSSTTPRFWECLFQLPVKIQDRAFEQYELCRSNPFHPSLQFNRTGRYWSVRVSRGYRSLATRHNHDLTRLWIGTHTEYERRLK